MQSLPIHHILSFTSLLYILGSLSHQSAEGSTGELRRRHPRDVTHLDPSATQRVAAARRHNHSQNNDPTDGGQPPPTHTKTEDITQGSDEAARLLGQTTTARQDGENRRKPICLHRKRMSVNEGTPGGEKDEKEAGQSRTQLRQTSPRLHSFALCLDLFLDPPRRLPFTFCGS